MGDSDEVRDTNPFPDLPKWPDATDEWLDCDSCHKNHRLTRHYRLLTIIFVIFVTLWRWDDHVYCPGCMRRHIAFYLLPKMLMATIAFPIVLLTWGWTFCRTFSRR